MKRIHWILWLLLGLCLACGVDRRQLEVQKKLAHAEFLMEKDPDSSYAILSGLDTGVVKGLKLLNMEYNLLLANAQNRTESPMMPLPEFLQTVEYYETSGTLKEKMLACYLAGRICVLDNDCPLAMEYFQRVLMMAENADAPYDYRTLYRTHSQMAEIYHNQRIFQKSVGKFRGFGPLATAKS